MIRVLYIFLFLAPLVSFSQQRIIVDWDLFKNDRPKDAKRQASISCGITYKPKLKAVKGDLLQINFEVKVGVDSSKSYFNFERKHEDYKLLNHEQGHADIALLHAIKLKTRFNETKFYKKDYNAVIKQLYSEASSQMHKQQLVYDEETNHGINEDMQTKWDAYLKKELNLN